MHYVFNCPSCGFDLKVESEEDREAVEMLCAKYASHMQENHPDIPAKKNMNFEVQNRMKKARVKSLERNC